MFNYSEVTIESLRKDLNNTIAECKELIEGLKRSTEIKLNHFNDMESMIYDLSGRIAFLVALFTL